MALIWGVNFSVIKYGARLLDPLAYNGMRVAMAAVALVAIVVVGGLPWPSRRHTIALLALGVLGNGIYQLFFVEGVAHTRASDAALVMAASPILVALIGRARGIERMHARGFVGIALSMTGIALVVFATTQAPPGQSTIWGDLLVLLSALSWSLYAVLLKPYTHDVNGIQLGALTMVGGAVPLVLLAAPAMARTSWTHVPLGGWVAMTYSGIGSLVIAYLIWYRGVRVLGPTRTAMYSNLQPALGVLVAWLTLGEVPTVWQIVGAAAIMAGLLLTRA
jgi:drug/metabolite transporter (DMT)-like permease